MRVRHWALLLATAISWSCATSRAFREGQREVRKGNWDMAVARLTLANQKDPGNIDYKIALENAKVQASRQHYDAARKAMAADDLDKAVVELEIASKYDPANRSAFEDLAIVRGKIGQREEEKNRLKDFEAMKAHAQAKTLPLPTLDPKSQVPIVLKFTDTSLEKVFDALSKLAGVNILLDPGFTGRDKKVTVNLQNVNFQQALDEVTFVNGAFYKVIDPHTIVIAAENSQSRRHYDDSAMKTFYLQNAEPDDTVKLLQTLFQPPVKAAANKALQSVTVRGTPDELAIVQKVVEANDKSRGEVMVEVEILEVNRTRMKEYGIALSNYEIHGSFNPSGGALDPSGFTSFQPQVLSSLNVSDFVVSIPSTLLAKFLANDSNVRLLAAPRLRAAEGEKTTLKIVTQVPVPQTTFQSTNTGGATFTPVTTTLYKDVGVNMDLTPKVSANGEITLKMKAEFSLQGQSVQINSTSFPEFLTRSVEGLLRVHDGETTLIGGLIQGREATSLAGVLGLQNIPILNKIFNHTTKDVEDTEILISLTPHLVRAPKLTEEDLRSILVGTQEAVKVPSARPLFGPEEPSPAPSPETATPQGKREARPPAPEAPAAPQAPPALPSPEPSPLAPQPSPAPSQATVEWREPVVTGRAGEILELRVVLLNAQGVTGVELGVAFDKSGLETVDILPGQLLTLDNATVDVDQKLEAGRVRAHFSRQVGTSGSGVVAVLRIRGLHPGTSGVVLESFTLTTASGTEGPILPGPLSVEVKP